MIKAMKDLENAKGKPAKSPERAWEINIPKTIEEAFEPTLAMTGLKNNRYFPKSGIDKLKEFLNEIDATTPEDLKDMDLSKPFLPIIIKIYEP